MREKKNENVTLKCDERAGEWASKRALVQVNEVNAESESVLMNSLDVYRCTNKYVCCACNCVCVCAEFSMCSSACNWLHRQLKSWKHSKSFQLLWWRESGEIYSISVVLLFVCCQLFYIFYLPILRRVNTIVITPIWCTFALPWWAFAIDFF